MAAQTSAATDLKSTFKVGDKVTWTSQANGHSSTKTGEIVATIPANEMSEPFIAECGGAKKFANTSKILGYSSRKHESFLVAVPAGKGKPRLYWPLASKLEAAKS